ncbi:MULTISPECIES: 23S rRNA (guanosine(2251)-2'-O)-methyltransferase RlmB [Weeksella]|uniref:RNA methyltransferase, TrmH family, group 3 n=1 Tax=Weeksella virosa (strain ATCC 43766 / DSM 16922 / JCM 21250 / CCUG 30538 / CDC 9751 / IAM 14551 / NBRC 16016 / NCTC 11634 / CL345/78) TaxID=865938 RepID=F0NXG1_WEEVC|nr:MULTISPECIES: 23S rRNA (guanosine(2251)-2'-O)-methyltransferase RlmB [Weeksella]ADX67951.1 RNA methyltransferase, TrmH family, group 3 [Weeksella virosa DSM 16922]MDK7374257.1 23S rRNA (guanosine(2251)-2'-O)-methyltransferase RlmB [Weeksella virosa]MDK7674560.1 23S rRNA (guanosine(2251)-2'-O)-methyltransferase RlmB [Weeksella virosa]OFM86115.1 23S rRNA (guanosine(2251)-2'-O)-methyltransferase RlmB [Weeksella sp. HMSC059D05]SUP54259.1 Putative TrmH family tRNA/rRNA methyltransferase [Weeksel
MKNEGGIFGLRPIIEAIESGKTIDKLFVQKGLQGEIFSQLRKLIAQYEIPTSYVPVEKLNRLTGKNHQGVYAFLSPIEFDSIENVLPQIYERGKTPFLLILDRVSDVRNFGAIARTAECVGIDAIIIPYKGSASVNADAVKTSAGALYNIPICKENNLKKTVDYLQQSGIVLAAASEKSDTYLYDVDFTTPLAIIMGSEEDGVSDALLKVSDYIIKLPMAGQTASLNVSVACGAILYEAVRQRLNVDLF